MLVAPLLFISNIISSRYIDPLQDDVLRRGLLRPDINEEIEIFAPPTVKCKSVSTTDRPICSRLGCTTAVYSRGLCRKHRYPCAIDDCEKQGVTGGYCIKHAKKHDPNYKKLICSRQGCTALAKSRDLCGKHAYPCATDGCEKQAQVGGYCRVHAKEHDSQVYDEYINKKLTCSRIGCKAKVHTRGLCKRHRYPCSVEDCDKKRQVGIYCISHVKEHDPDAYHQYKTDRPICSRPGCTALVCYRGLCRKHRYKNKV